MQGNASQTSHLMFVILSEAKNPATSKLMTFVKCAPLGLFENNWSFDVHGSSWMFRFAQHDSNYQVF
jgi:hypothetical protein